MILIEKKSNESVRWYLTIKTECNILDSREILEKIRDNLIHKIVDRVHIATWQMWNI